MNKLPLRIVIWVGDDVARYAVVTARKSPKRRIRMYQPEGLFEKFKLELIYKSYLSNNCNNLFKHVYMRVNKETGKIMTLMKKNSASELPRKKVIHKTFFAGQFMLWCAVDFISAPRAYIFGILRQDARQRRVYAARASCSCAL